MSQHWIVFHEHVFRRWLPGGLRRNLRGLTSRASSKRVQCRSSGCTLGTWSPCPHDWDIRGGDISAQCHTEFHLPMSLIIIDVLFGAFASTASNLTWYDLIWFDMVWYSLTVTHPRIPLVLAAELLQWLASSHWFADQFGGLRHLRVLEPGISSPNISRNVEEHHDAMVSK